MKRSFNLLWASALAALLFIGLSACQEPADAPTSESVQSAAMDSPLGSGKITYERYCANCHGTEAHGNGPIAGLLKVPPPDLTLLSANNGGVFPVDSIYMMIDGREDVASHGTREMPVWGNVWGEKDGLPVQPEAVEHQINEIIEYLRTLQRTPTT